jgi:hypothetical protein
MPVWAVEENAFRSTSAMEPLSGAAILAMLADDARREATADAGGSETDNRRHVVSVTPSDIGSTPLAVIVCDLHTSPDSDQFRRRADELSLALATILYACPERSSEEAP